MTTRPSLKSDLPPGDHGHWLLGINAQVTDPLGVLVRGQRRHGDIVYFNSFQGPTYLLAHPDHAQHVLVDNARNYPSPDKPPNRLMGNGLFVSNGDFWMRQRRMVPIVWRHFGQRMTRTTRCGVNSAGSSTSGPSTRRRRRRRSGLT